MKRLLIFTAIVFLSFHFSANAQRFYIGAKTGMSSSSFSGDGFDVSKFRTSYQAGLFMGFTFADNEWFALQPEMLYDRRGSRQLGVVNNGTVQEIRSDFFTMPIAAKFRIPIQEKFFPHFTMGPYWSARVNQTIGSRTDIPLQDHERIDIRKVDFGAFVGAGADFQFNPFFLTVDMRYFFGGINQNASDNIITIRNSQVTLNVGAGFIF
jgi:hypothetical protein